MHLSGFEGYVVLGADPGGVTYCFGKWDADISTKAVPTNNFCSQGFNQNVAGFTGAKINCSGPYDAGNMPLTSGVVYEFHLGFVGGATPIELVITARVTNIKPSNDAEGTPQLAISAESTGLFEASIDESALARASTAEAPATPNTGAAPAPTFKA